MKDPLDQEARSERMSRVRSTGNKSTELRAESGLVAAGISGWWKQPKDVVGRPDFYFPRQRLAIFVDGCFWHSCPVCKRNMPSANGDFWRKKIDDNRRRDNRQRRQLRKQGYHVMRVWEHELGKDIWIRRVKATLRRIESQVQPNQADAPDRLK